MSVFNTKKNQKKMVEHLVVTIANFRLMAFDENFEKHLKGDTSKMSDIEKSYLWFSHVLTEMMEKLDIDSYKGKIDDELFLIIRDLYYNLCLFVDGIARIDEIVLQHTRPSLLMLFEQSRKVYDYQIDIAGNNVQKLYDKMTKRVKELYPEVGQEK